MSKLSGFSPTTAAAIVIANMIGTGVFTSLGFQLVDIKSGFVILLLWILGGVIAISGALCYAELGARLPRSGGEYNFLSQIYHPMAGFISGCVSATVGFAAPTALAAITFGVYLSSVFSQLSPLWLATGLVVVMTLVHATSHRNSGNMQTFFTIAKIVLVIGFSIAALYAVDNYQLVRFTPESSDIELITSGSFAVALIYVGYAYSGWNAATYLTGELENPAKTLPIVLAVGTGVVMLSYILLNTVFLLVAPIDAMEGKLEIGYVAATYAFGDIGASIMGVTLALLLVSTVSAMIIAAPRVLQVVGEDFAVFRFLSKLNKNGVPATAVYLQGGITLLFLWTASFESILIFSGATMALNTLFAVIGVFILRHREGDESVESMPVFRVPFYPLPPLLFVALTGGTLIYLTIERPVEIIFSFVVIGAGAIAYLLSQRFER
ncbi:MAG: APA family basic amino acid/polyamine antiporter [Chitinophagales bacterium]|jgi:APA family basic amino acid/polyamine antiporter